MEEKKITDTEFYKVRSYSACLMNGFKLFADNLWTLFKHTWTSVLFFSLCVSLCSFLYQPVARLVFSSADPSRLPYFPQIMFAYLILFLLSVAVPASSFFSGTLTVLARQFIATGSLRYAVKGRIEKAALSDSLRWLCLSFVFLLAAALLSGGFHYLVGTAWWTWFWDLALVLALYIPYGVFVLRNTLDARSYSLSPSVFKSVYQNWGSWSAVFFVSGLFGVLCMVFFSMPAFVLLYARSEAFFMELGGDLTDLPVAFSLMQFLIVLFSAALSLFFFSACYLSLLFMHGSLKEKQSQIAQYEKEQQSLMQA